MPDRQAEYWQKRAEDVNQRIFETVDEYVQKLRKIYDEALRRMEAAVGVYAARYAQKTGLDIEEARRLLTDREMEAFRMTIEEFIQKAQDVLDPSARQRLDYWYYRSRVRRLEALLAQLQMWIDYASGRTEEMATDAAREVIETKYNDALYEASIRMGFLVSDAVLSRDYIEKILNTRFLGVHYSERIWANRDKLAQELERELTQSFILGESTAQTSARLAAKMDTAYKNAARLVRTESSFFAHQAQLDAYEANGVERYQYVATLDDRTSEMCRRMDGKVFKLSDAKEGVNYPPLHPNCRSTTIAYFEGVIAERAARDKAGRAITVPGHWTYEDWYRAVYGTDPASGRR